LGNSITIFKSNELSEVRESLEKQLSEVEAEKAKLNSAFEDKELKLEQLQEKLDNKSHENEEHWNLKAAEMAEQQALLDKERLRAAEVESKDRELKLREESFAENLAEFREELEQLETAQKEFASNKKIIEPERADLDMEVEQVHAQLEEARFLHSQQVNKEKESLNGLQAELEAQRIILEQKEEGLRQLEAKEEEVQLGLAEINARREVFEFDRRKFDDELQQVEKGRAELDQGWADLDAEANRLHETLGEERSKIEQQLKGDREAIAQREIELSLQQEKLISEKDEINSA
jgi:chromosome segregation ATPase